MASCNNMVASMLTLSILIMMCYGLTSIATAAKAGKNITSFEVFNVLAIQGTNSTQGYNTVQCGGPAVTQPNLFGTIYCFDMPLLQHQDVNSELLGRVQGTFTIAQLTGGAVFVTETFILNTTSLLNKGSFSASGIENIGQVSSKPITGGTDDYALVTGDAITTPLGGVTIDQFGNSIFWFRYKFVFAHT